MKKTRIPRIEKMREAKCRMLALGINMNTIKRFMEYSMVPCYITGTDETRLYTVNEKDVEILLFEQHYKAVVYAVIITPSENGVMKSLLFVSEDKDEWDDDIRDILDGDVLVWTSYQEPGRSPEFSLIPVTTSEYGALARSDFMAQ